MEGECAFVGGLFLAVEGEYAFSNTEGRGQKSEVGGQKSEVGGQWAEGGSQQTEDRGRNFCFLLSAFTFHHHQRLLEGADR